jgi:nucleotide-binding universal stress UspA family protein
MSVDPDGVRRDGGGGAAGAPAGGPGAEGASEQPVFGPIVVGVDGSPTSRDALVWAAQEAELRGCELVAVYGWQVSTEPRPAGVGIGVTPPLDEYQRCASEKVQRIVAETLGPGRPRPPARLSVRAVHRTPGRALIDESKNADLLVLGSKGHGRLAAWLLGSIREEAMQRAPCSVVIVRQRPGDQRG